jgi:hypothetical protein
MNSNNTLHFYNTSGSGTSTCLLNAILPEKVQNAIVENNNPNSLRQIIQTKLKEIINKIVREEIMNELTTVDKNTDSSEIPAIAKAEKKDIKLPKLKSL